MVMSGTQILDLIQKELRNNLGRPTPGAADFGLIMFKKALETVSGMAQIGEDGASQIVDLDDVRRQLVAVEVAEQFLQNGSRALPR